jgi:hypothetical protein
MTSALVLEKRLYEAISPAGLRAAERDLAVDLCLEVVAMVPDLGLPHQARTARSAVQLLLSQTLPGLDRELRNDLARLCEVAVVRGL